MAGLLDFLNSPAGIGLLSAVAGGAAGARQGTPWNNAGRGALAGLQGYQGAQNQLKADAEDAVNRQFKQSQADKIQAEIARKNAMQTASAQAAQASFKQPVEAQYAVDGNAGNADFANMAADQNQFINDAQGSRLQEQPTQTREAQAGGFDPAAYKQNMLTQLAQAGMPEEAVKFAPDTKPITLGKTLIDPTTGKVLATDQTWQEDQKTARSQRIDELKMRLEDQQLSREQNAALRREIADQQTALRRDLSAQSSADRRMVAGIASADRRGGNNKPMPAAALKMQQEELDGIGTASSINADLGAIQTQLKTGKLQLGLVNNLTAKARNYVGASDESSRNLATFQATLERLRNDSLRLNKGVQTDGDSQRAWNELVTNINDPKVVAQRLEEIKNINERAANIRRMNVDGIRRNYGKDPLDSSGYSNQDAALGTPTPQQKPMAVKSLPTKAPAGVDAKVWQHMTPQERKLWAK